MPDKLTSTSTRDVEALRHLLRSDLFECRDPTRTYEKWLSPTGGIAVELFLHGVEGGLKECLVWRVESDCSKPHELLGEADEPTPEWLDEVLP